MGAILQDRGGYPTTYNLTKPLRQELLREVKGKTKVDLSDIRRISKAKNVAAKSIHSLFQKNGITITSDRSRETRAEKHAAEVEKVFGPAPSSMEVIEDEKAEDITTPSEPLDFSKAMAEFAKVIQQAAGASSQVEKAKYDKLETEALQMSEEADRLAREAKEQMARTAELRKETKAVREQLDEARGEAERYRLKYRQVAKQLEAAHAEIARLEDQAGFTQADQDELTLRRIRDRLCKGKLGKDESVLELERVFNEASARLEARFTKTEEPKQLDPHPTPMVKPAARLLDIQTIARRYGVSPTSVSNWKRKGFPEPAKYEYPKFLYDAAEVDEWAKAHGKTRVQPAPKVEPEPKPEPKPESEGKYLTTLEVAKRYGVSRTSVSNWRHEGFPEPAVKKGMTFYYHVGQVDAWAKAHGKTRVT